MALRGTNQEFGRPYNRRIVLEVHPPARSHRPRRDRQRASASPSRPSRPSFASWKSRATSCRCAKSRRGAACRRRRCGSIPEGGYAVGIHLTPLGINAALINLSGDVDREHAPRSAERDARPCLRPDRRDGARIDQTAARRTRSRRRHGPARTVRRGVHELRRPDHHDRLEGCGAARAAGGLDRTAGLLRNRHGGGGPRRAALRPRRRIFRILLPLFRRRPRRRHGA